MAGQSRNGARGALRKLRVVLWIVVALAAVPLLLIGLQNERGEPATATDVVRVRPPVQALVPVGAPWSLIDETGTPVSSADFHGGYLVLYFGFTNCPDICPASLGTLAVAMDLMPAEAAERVTPGLVTLDPERDTPAFLADYVSVFHERMKGFTGTRDQIDRVAGAFRVYHQRAALPGRPADEYLIDHSSYFYVVGPDGAVIDTIAGDTDPEELAAILTARVRG